MYDYIFSFPSTLGYWIYSLFNFEGTLLLHYMWCIRNVSCRLRRLRLAISIFFYKNFWIVLKGLLMGLKNGIPISCIYQKFFLTSFDSPQPAFPRASVTWVKAHANTRLYENHLFPLLLFSLSSSALFYSLLAYISPFFFWNKLQFVYVGF